ncbi:MAG: Rrf2 family transcriptional regulator, partial [Chloroflexi bacterium]|nr:Rrf2 family transcriptional regulator [Chloroflexota bacterium]
MKISTRTRYGTRAMLDIALHEGKGPVQLKAIAERQEISLPYLEHIVAPLIRAGFLRTTRGPAGGVSLRKRPQDIRIREIIEALDGSIAPVD